ncbi:energy transducer TonB [Nitrospina watsonii]|uniref:TonB C-terminal domain-containing protein n=1 Tax=Nitrospina watsonii TaxID=1323948 RepID=A0ABM9HEB0_9BACT|nr:energy transducer TonB [Nitrospina watsonii]CAI2718585.1 protein of unknown function [Nitrospina watsonii]
MFITATHSKSNRIFQGALACSLALHGFVFLGFILWQETFTETPLPQTFKIQKVRLLTSPMESFHEETGQSKSENISSNSPAEIHHEPITRTFKKNPVQQRSTKETATPTIMPHAVPDPLIEPVTPSVRIHETVQKKVSTPQPKLHSQKTFSLARLSPNPVTARKQASVLPEPMPKIKPLPEPIPRPQPPRHEFKMQSGKSALLHTTQWEPPARNRYSETIQQTRSFARPLQTANAQRIVPLAPDTLELKVHADEDHAFAAPTASWTAPQQNATNSPEVPISKSVATSGTPPHETAGTTNVENKESVSQQFASKGITGSRSGGEDLETLKNGFILEIRNRIAKYKFYPRLAMRRGLEGQPIVHFKINRDGRIQDLHVALTSGSGILDQAALESVKNGMPFPVMPEALQRDSMTIQLPIAFTLD